MKHESSLVHQVKNVILILGFLALSWTIAFYSTKAICTQFKWEPHELVIFLVNSSLGCVIFGIGIRMANQFSKHRAHYFHIEMLEAIKRISHGDFRVKLDLSSVESRRKSWKMHPFIQLVESINVMAANLKEMEELRQEFISNVSHEIGSPLTSIRGFAKALKDDKLDPKVRQKYLNIMETECERLSKISDNLMKLAVLDSSQQTFNPRKYELDQQIISLILACEPKWQAKEMDMNVEVDKLEIYADEDLLSVVWTNLIHNSIKFTPHGGNIHISIEKLKNNVIFRITDTGPGIPEHDQPRIFERFYKVDKSRARMEGGSGLGLSIAHKIVELHRGSISVYSKPGEGAEFIVTLPIMVAELR